MDRLSRVSIQLFLAYLLVAGTASATTYYIASNGSDSNNGASQTSAWLHAPGMTGCTANCASASPQPGDQFIFRGGDTWHYSAGSPVGLPWTWHWNGSNGNPIYIGVNQSWYSGSSWSRPVLSMDNPLSTSQPSSCTYPDDNYTAATLNNVSYVTFDNFEFSGKCWSGNPNGAYLWAGSSSTNITVSNNYFHGWTMATTASNDRHFMIGASTVNSNTGNVYASNVFDGSDSSLGTVCNAPSCVKGTYNGGATGWAIGGECYDVHENVFRHVSNGIECGNITIVHDNLFEYLFEPINNSPHGNVVESLGGITGETAYFYNNVTRNVNEGVNWWPQFATAYIFNNVWENDGHYPPDPNCLMMSPPGSSNIPVVVTVYAYNNTFDGTCAAQAQAGNTWTPHWASGSTITFANNHILDRTSTSQLFTCNAPSVCNQVENGGEVFQTTAQANAQGYTLSNDYQPTTSGGATVGAGVNESNVCSTFSHDNDLCDGTSDGVSEGSGDNAIYPAIAMNARSSSWDAGAYEFSSGGGIPAPPTGLSATVQ